MFVWHASKYFFISFTRKKGYQNHPKSQEPKLQNYQLFWYEKHRVFVSYKVFFEMWNVAPVSSHLAPIVTYIIIYFLTSYLQIPRIDRIDHHVPHHLMNNLREFGTNSYLVFGRSNWTGMIIITTCVAWWYPHDIPLISPWTYLCCAGFTRWGD